jgi:PAS domain S-box-containing protein
MQDRRKTKQELLDELTSLRGRLRELEKAKPRLEEGPYTEVANALLRLFAGATSRQEYMSLAVRLIKIWSDCQYVGVRMVKNNGDIPYESYLGFSREFWESENWLSIHKDQCACVRVITGKPESQDLAAMTRGGSFYLEDSLDFLQSLSQEQQARFRGVCVQCGFKSIAIIPITFRGKILGVIHIADEEGGKVARRSVESLEGVAFLMGQATQKFVDGEEERTCAAHLHLLMELSRDFVGLLSPEGEYLGVNAGGCLLQRYDDPGVLLGKPFAANIIKHQELVADALTRAAAGEEVSVQYQSADLGGREIWWSSRLTPVRRTDGRVASILSIAQDITGRQRN